MKYTTNLNLKKPDLEDYVLVDDLNDNMDVLDQEVGILKQGLTGLGDLTTENKTITGAINEINKNLSNHIKSPMPHTFVKNGVTYKYGLSINDSADGLVFNYEEMI